MIRGIGLRRILQHVAPTDIRKCVKIHGRCDVCAETRLIEDLKSRGVRGYTICTVRGEGHHGLRSSQWEGENIKIEAIVDGVLAGAIGEHVAKAYFPHFATILYLLPVQVLREQKFM